MIRASNCLTTIVGTLLLISQADATYGAEPALPVKLTLYPSPQPIPALKYRLSPGRLDQKPGNAAVYYGKVTAEEMRFFSNREMLDNIDRWQQSPLAELRDGQVSLPTSGAIEGSIRRGAHCRFCDWQLPIGDVPFYGMLLPEIQQTREFGRILSVRARMQIADGEFADAVETLQSGYSLGRHVAAGETIVNGLVGIAICEIMSRQVLEFVQQPQAPNLYWALTMLPRPLVEVNDAVDVEAMGVELSFPELRDVHTAVQTPEEWRQQFHRFAQDFVKEAGNIESPELPSADELDARCERMLPVAKDSLIESGLSAKTVADMPLHQIALLYSLQTYHHLLEDAIKYYYLPFPNAIVGLDTAILRANREQLEIIPIAQLLMPAIKSSRAAIARNDRRIAVLRVIEALRIYGASHEGKLPELLADITEVPIPNDPVTELPFEYRLEGETASLTGPTLRDVPLHFEITMIRL
jgi:hypothetical protein